jgi:hypothetical protein
MAQLSHWKGICLAGFLFKDIYTVLAGGLTLSKIRKLFYESQRNLGMMKCMQNLYLILILLKSGLHCIMS